LACLVANGAQEPFGRLEELSGIVLCGGEAILDLNVLVLGLETFASDCALLVEECLVGE